MNSKLQEWSKMSVEEKVKQRRKTCIKKYYEKNKEKLKIKYKENYKSKKIDRKCVVCGNIGHNVSNRWKFCCGKCRLIYHKKMKIGFIDIECALCGKIEKKAYDRQRYCIECIPIARKLQEKKDAKKYYLRNKKEIKERVKKRKRENNERTPTITENERIKSDIRIKCYNKVKIPNGQLCERCGKNLAIQRHHPDYNKIFEVEFLCIPCHQKQTNIDNKNIKLEKFIKITGGMNL